MKKEKQATKKPDPATPDKEESKSSLPTYSAFAAQDRIKFLNIEKANGITHAPAYAYLLDIISDGERGEEVALLYSFMLVKIKGRNLWEIAQAISMHDCHFIAEYDASRYAPSEPDAPLIENIEFVTREGKEK